MKITFELEDNITIVTNQNAITVSDALELFQRVLWGAGYVLRGEVTIEEPEVLDSGRDTEGD